MMVKINHDKMEIRFEFFDETDLLIAVVLRIFIFVSFKDF